MALSSRSLITKTGISTTQVFDMGGINISGGDFNLGSNIKLGNASGIITATAFKLSDGSNVGGVESDGSQNTVGGTNAGDSIVSGGTENTVFGYNAGTAISTGDNNTFFGSRAGRSISTGLQNSGVGYNVMGNTSGTGNAALGQNAGNGIGAGSYNVALGWSALSDVSTNGANNIVIGKQANVSAANMSNEITLGNSDITHLRVPGIGVSFRSHGAYIAGVVTATSFSGSGANLTSLPAANLTGTLPAISGANLTSLPAQATIANNADNRVITGGSGVNLNGEATLTFDGTTLTTSGSGGINISQSGSDLTMNSAGAIFTGNGGNATNPIVANVSDTNTGFFYPAADTISVTTGGSERFRIHSTGKVIIGTGNRNQETSTGAVLIDRDITAESDQGDPNNYHLVLRSQTNSNTSKLGIGFVNTSDDTTVGASILHHRTGGGSVGDLAFYTSPSDGTINERFRIDSTGRVGINKFTHADSASALTIQNGASGSDHSILDIICNDNETSRIYFSEDSNSAKGQIRYTYTGDNNYMSFYTNGNSSGNERIRITSDGKIGVNATNTALIAPGYTLDLGGNDGSLDTSEQNTLRIRCNNGGTAIRVGSGGGSSRVVLVRVDGDSSNSNCMGQTDAGAFGASLVYHGDRSGNENSFAVYMDQTNNASQIEAFNIRQNGDYMHSGSSYSDRDHKDNITSIPGTALDKITQLSPRTWNWKPEYHDIPTDRIFGGFIAQEVQSHIPSIVRGTDGQGDMSIDYQGLLAWTIKALTELKSENDNLKARVNTLEGS